MGQLKIADRFDTVYQAWLQTGKTYYFRDDQVEILYPGVMEELQKYHVCHSTEAWLDMENSKKLVQKSALIRNNQVKLYNMKTPKDILDTDLYISFQKWEENLPVKAFSVSQEVLDLVYNTKFNITPEEFVEHINEYLDKYCGIYYCDNCKLYENWNAIMVIPLNRRYQEACLKKLNEVRKHEIILIDYDNVQLRANEKDAVKVFSLVAFMRELMNCKKTPLESENNIRLENIKKTERIYDNSVSHRTVNISKSYKQHIQNYINTSEKHINKDNLLCAPTFIGGYIRTQHYGKNWAETKSIYVDGFVRNQWKAKATHTRVISTKNF